jgi:aspartate 1-decarboxylase
MRLVQLLKSKIHHAHITYANADYVGSLEVDSDLLDCVGLLPGEHVHVWNIENGERFETYVIPGEPGSGVIGLNGAAAIKGKSGDRLIIAAFTLTDEPITPKMALVDKNNHFVRYLEAWDRELKED